MGLVPKVLGGLHFVELELLGGERYNQEFSLLLDMDKNCYSGEGMHNLLQFHTNSKKHMDSLGTSPCGTPVRIFHGADRLDSLDIFYQLLD